MTVWDPEQYDRFAAERRQPFLDLLALVEPRPGMTVVDLGCGTGELTRLLHDRLGAAATLGVDRSPEMLARGAELSLSRPGLRFVVGDLADTAGRFDLVFSNAALHWLSDHERLLPRLVRLIAPGGQLAIQVPANHHHPSHRIADQIAGEDPFREPLGGFRRGWSVLTPSRYAELLYQLGFARRTVRLEVYGHLLDGVDQVVEWVKGTLLTAYQERLSAELYSEFLARYRRRLHRELGDLRPYFYTYDRILLWAAEPAVC